MNENDKVKELEGELIILQNEKRVVELKLEAALNQIKAWELVKQAGELMLAVEAAKAKKGGES
jgi:hypothetical protein